MCGVSGVELIVIIAVAIIFLGPDKLPELARWVGRGMREVRKLTGDLSKMREEIQSSMPVEEMRQQIREELQLERARARKLIEETEIDKIRARKKSTSAAAAAEKRAAAEAAAVAAASTDATDGSQPQTNDDSEGATGTTKDPDAHLRDVEVRAAATAVARPSGPFGASPVSSSRGQVGSDAPSPDAEGERQSPTVTEGGDADNGVDSDTESA